MTKSLSFYIIPIVVLFVAATLAAQEASQPTKPDVLFIVVAPGVTKPGSQCERPIDMTVLYPTLLELCGLHTDSWCDGQSIVPLLRDSSARWERPALMTYLRGNHAVRSERWRYIRYTDGTEELYDHERDPQEWHNIAGDPKFADVVAAHRKWLPQSEAQPVADLRR